jgi:hypothetical protein
MPLKLVTACELAQGQRCNLRLFGSRERAIYNLSRGRVVLYEVREKG